MRPNYKVRDLTQDYLAQKYLDGMEADRPYRTAERRMMWMGGGAFTALVALATWLLWRPPVLDDASFRAGVIVGSCSMLVGLLLLVGFWAWREIHREDRGLVGGWERRG